MITTTHRGALTAALAIVFVTAVAMTGTLPAATEAARSPGGALGGLAVLDDQLWHQDSLNVEDQAETGDAFGEAVAIGDFNGDGIGDLAIGDALEGVNGAATAGAVNVLYGSSPNGLTAAGDQIWHQDVPDVEGVAEEHDLFGSALAAGDFNNDGHDDLAVGAWGEDVGTVDSAGAVNVLYGSDAGLTAEGNQIWDQDTANVGGASEEDDHFGSVLAAGDFDNDGNDDLAIGVLREEVGGIATAGAVNVLYGSGAGLTAEGNQLWDQDTPNVEGVAEEGDFFGAALAAGDFDGDGHDDLAIGVPQEAVGDASNAGAVNVLYGSLAGLAVTGDQIWHQDVADVEGVAEEDDVFGWALAAGDFNGDGDADLAIGDAFEDVGDVGGAGAVNVLYGSPAGLAVAGDQIWDQESANIEGAAGVGDHFGETLAAGDFDDNGSVDLAIGVPGEDVDGVSEAGAVNVIYGSNGGLTSAGDQPWHRNGVGVEDDPGPGDSFGLSLATGDLNDAGADDLAIGVPNDDVNGIVDAGAVNVIYSDFVAPTATATRTATATATATVAASATATSLAAATSTSTSPAAATPTGTPPAPATSTPTLEPGATSTPTSPAAASATATSPAAATATATRTPTKTPTRTPTTPPGGLAGDANCDGHVNSIDASLMLQLSAGLVQHLSCEDAADVNHDGHVNAIDASLVLQYVAGLINQLPP
jgi:hypothetical protein